MKSNNFWFKTMSEPLTLGYNDIVDRIIEIAPPYGNSTADSVSMESEGSKAVSPEEEKPKKRANKARNKKKAGKK